jgi:hypothetical protein
LASISGEDDHPLPPSVVETIRAWLPQVMICLLIQSGIAATGLLFHHWLDNSRPCCDRSMLL